MANKQRRSSGDGNTRRQGSGPRVSKGVADEGVRAPSNEKPGTSHSALGDPVWAVIDDHYVAFDMTYDEARAEVDRLKTKKQPGVVIVTNETAKRMASGAAGVTASSLPDMKF